MAEGSLSNVSRQGFIDLFNSLGTPTTTQTITIGSTNLAKLTSADIQIAYDKNWAISPTPAAFTLSLDSDTYSVAYGTTWATWVASADNTNGYQIVNGFVRDSTGTKVILGSDGNYATATSLIRGGVSYESVNPPTSYTIPYAGNERLTVSYVQSLASYIGGLGVTEVIVPAQFTVYEVNALDELSGTSVSKVTTYCPLKAASSMFVTNVMYSISQITAMDFMPDTVIADTFHYYDIEELRIANATTFPSGINFTYNGALKVLRLDKVTALSGAVTNEISAQHLERVYAPLAASLSRWDGSFVNPKFFIGTDNCSLDSNTFAASAYVKATKLPAYTVATNWVGKTIIGVIDGASVYTPYEMAYPTLSATLTIDSSGHLIDDGADLFSGYTATWYSDEDCTTAIADPTTIASSDTVYVKLA